jgi:hypothetical protein
MRQPDSRINISQLCNKLASSFPSLRTSSKASDQNNQTDCEAIRNDIPIEPDRNVRQKFLPKIRNAFPLNEGFRSSTAIKSCVEPGLP